MSRALVTDKNDPPTQKHLFTIYPPVHRHSLRPALIMSSLLSLTPKQCLYLKHLYRKRTRDCWFLVLNRDVIILWTSAIVYTQKQAYAKQWCSLYLHPHQRQIISFPLTNPHCGEGRSRGATPGRTRGAQWSKIKAEHLLLFIPLTVQAKIKNREEDIKTIL